MSFKNVVTSPSFEHRAFLALMVAVTLAFVWILLPFGGAVFWGAVIAIVFTPVYGRLYRRWPQRPTLAALVTMSLVLVMAVVPMTLLAGMLLKEGAALYQRVQSGETNFARYFEQVVAVSPAWLHDLLEHFGLTDFNELQTRISEAIGRGSQLIATQVYSVGQNALDLVVSFFVMLYLAFFLLRDGAALSQRLRVAVPLAPEHRRQLTAKFITVIRATVKGNVLVAATQGALGGLAFWFFGIKGALLWAVVMGFLSLLPAIGAGLIWLPVALYFLVTGATWQGVALIAYGVLVIGLVDNVLRPILVGKDTQMPDYLVLISTIGGMAVFGINGFVIGPAIAAMFLAVWDLFTAAREQAVAQPMGEPATGAAAASGPEQAPPSP